MNLINLGLTILKLFLSKLNEITLQTSFHKKPACSHLNTGTGNLLIRDFNLPLQLSAQPLWLFPVPDHVSYRTLASIFSRALLRHARTRSICPLHGKLRYVFIVYLHTTSRSPHWCAKTKQQRPCWSLQLILCMGAELFSLYLKTFFCFNNLQNSQPRER